MESPFSGVFKSTSRYLKKRPAFKGWSVISEFSLCRVLLPRQDMVFYSLTVHQIVSSVMRSDWLSKRFDPIGHFQVVFCQSHKRSMFETIRIKMCSPNANQIHFRMKSFARGLVSKQRHKETRKWLITALDKHKNRNIPTITFIALDSCWKTSQMWFVNIDVNWQWIWKFLYRSNLNYD